MSLATLACGAEPARVPGAGSEASESPHGSERHSEGGDCRQLPECAAEGRCWSRLAQDGPDHSRRECLPKLDTDCAESAACRNFGNCALGGKYQTRCEPHLAVQCEASAACQRHGACEVLAQTVLNDSFYFCGSAAGAHCRDAALCKELGRCHSTRRGKCVADSDADCTASDVCQNAGQCAAKNGACVRR